MTFDEALPLVREIVSELSEGEQLRLLKFFCRERAQEIKDVKPLKIKSKDENSPGFDPKKNRVNAVAGGAR